MSPSDASSSNSPVRSSRLAPRKPTDPKPAFGKTSPRAPREVSSDKAYSRPTLRKPADSPRWREKPAFGKNSPRAPREASSDKAYSRPAPRKLADSPRRREKPAFGKNSPRAPREASSNKAYSRPAPRKPGKSAEREDGLIRLNKYMASSGVGSRRQADELIKQGFVTVNKTIITTMGYKVAPGDVVHYNGQVLKAEKLAYILLNKPKGFITTTDDPDERKTVMDLVAGASSERIYPVGRLDRSTTGLLLLTNDGELANKLTHPSYKIKKVYKAELNRPITREDLKRLRDGVWLEEGKAKVDDAEILTPDKKTIGLELHIGWNRIVHRMFGALGYEVLKLDRSLYSGLTKKDLPRGKWRALRHDEIVRLKHF